MRDLYIYTCNSCAHYECSGFEITFDYLDLNSYQSSGMTPAYYEIRCPHRDEQHMFFPYYTYVSGGTCVAISGDYIATTGDLGWFC